MKTGARGQRASVFPPWKVVQHQATHRHGEGGEAEELGSTEVPYRGVSTLLGRYLQTGAYHGHQETAGARSEGEAADYRFPDGC